MFQEHTPVKHVHAWLEEQHAKDSALTNVEIPGYVMLWRYYKRVKVSAMDQVVQENAQESIERNWDAATMIIQQGLKAISLGSLPTAKEVVAAIKIQNDLIDRHGGIPGQSEIQKDAKRRFNLFVDLVLEIITDEQKAVIADRIADTPDLYEWTTVE